MFAALKIDTKAWKSFLRGHPATVKISGNLRSALEDVPRSRTFRARGISHGLDVQGARTLLCSSLEAEVLSLDSLAASSDRKKEQVATFRLSQKPRKLDSDRTEWLVPAARLEGDPGKQFLVDTHFEGFTPLHGPVGNSEDALSILTGGSGQSEAKVLQLRSHLRVRKPCLWLMERSR